MAFFDSLLLPFPYLDMDLTYYLSGPMTGIEKYNYPQFEAAQQALTKMGLKVVSPHTNPPPPGIGNMEEHEIWSYYMELCYRQMEQCDGIILLPDWFLSNGSRAEVEIILGRERPIILFYDLFNDRVINMKGLSNK